MSALGRHVGRRATPLVNGWSSSLAVRLGQRAAVPSFAAVGVELARRRLPAPVAGAARQPLVLATPLPAATTPQPAHAIARARPRAGEAQGGRGGERPRTPPASGAPGRPPGPDAGSVAPAGPPAAPSSPSVRPVLARPAAAPRPGAAPAPPPGLPRSAAPDVLAPAAGPPAAGSHAAGSPPARPLAAQPPAPRPPAAAPPAAGPPAPAPPAPGPPDAGTPRVGVAHEPIVPRRGRARVGRPLAPERLGPVLRGVDPRPQAGSELRASPATAHAAVAGDEHGGPRARVHATARHEAAGSRSLPAPHDREWAVTVRPPARAAALVLSGPRPRRREPVEQPRAVKREPLPLAPAPAPVPAPPPAATAAPASAATGAGVARKAADSAGLVLPTIVGPTATPWPSPTAPATEPDVGLIAERVYGLLTQRLARERERRGW